MDTPATEQPRRRRRGPALESALLDAAWDELVEVGFANLTMETVATRAHTGVQVLYRRWANKAELVMAAFDHYRRQHPVHTPDTGSLRGDLLARLTTLSEARAALFAIGTATAFSGLLADTGLTLSQARDKVTQMHPFQHARDLYQRAHDRGEIDLRRIPDAVLDMPFDVVRHDLLMSLQPLPRARIESVVDELALPLIRYYDEHR